MSKTPEVTYVETSRDDKWIYGDRFVDDEFVSTWMQALPKEVQGRTYGLPLYEADILVRDKDTADYFEALVLATENIHLPALWLITKMDEKDIPSDFNLRELFVKFSENCPERPDPTQVAKFIINELMAAAKRSKVEITDIPVSFAALLLVYRKNRLLDNKRIKILIDEHFESLKKDL